MVLLLRIGGAARAARREDTRYKRHRAAGPLFCWACVLGAWFWLGPVWVGSIALAQTRAGSPAGAAPRGRVKAFVPARRASLAHACSPIVAGADAPVDATSDRAASVHATAAVPSR